MEIKTYQTKLKVIGCGGAGNNTLKNLGINKTNTLETIAVNTDAHDLLSVEADKRLLIGNALTQGLGAGGDPQIGEHAAKESLDLIKAALEGADMVFLTCGMGGGTGTGSIPVISHIARHMGILTMAIVTMPFSEEGIIRWENAQIGLEKLRKNVDSLIVLRNDRLVELYPDMQLDEAFKTGDSILMNAILGVSSLILENGLINLDFADISMVLKDGPEAIIGVGESNSENRVNDAFNKIVKHPLMDSDISGAQSALVQICSGPNIKLSEAREVIRLISQKLDPNARIIWGVNIVKHMRNSIKILIIASGMQKDMHYTRNLIHYESNNQPEPEQYQTTYANSADFMNNGQSIFDIKESIIASGAESAPKPKKRANTTQTNAIFYNIMQEEALSDLKRFDRAVHLLRQDNGNRKAVLDAKQACKLLQASAQMFGFDEIFQLLSAIEDILNCSQTREISLNTKMLDSITLAMEMVVDLIENQNDGRGETGYIIDRLRELKEEPLES